MYDELEVPDWGIETDRLLLALGSSGAPLVRPTWGPSWPRQAASARRCALWLHLHRGAGNFRSEEVAGGRRRKGLSGQGENGGWAE